MSSNASYLIRFKWTLATILATFSWLIFSSGESEISEKLNYSTSSNGDFLNPSIWYELNTSTSSNQNCAISSEKELTINHEVTSQCQVTELYGEGILKIEQNGSLTLNGDLDLFGNSLLEIIEGGTLKINGNLSVSGNAEVRSSGSLIVSGSVLTQGDAEVCGLGVAVIGGKVNGLGVCMKLNPQFKNTIKSSSRQLNETAHALEWKMLSIMSGGEFVLSESTNGMSYYSIDRIPAKTDTAKKYSVKVIPNQLKTNYYRIEYFNQKGDLTCIKTEVINSGKFIGSGCPVIFSPDPCSPNCSVEIKDCYSKQWNMSSLDLMGNIIQNTFTKIEAKRALSYHVSTDNYLMPSVYIIPEFHKDSTPRKKRIIK